ncbi:hypothetical protein KCU74_g1, partial [Aureobasidium melanogenum]
MHLIVLSINKDNLVNLLSLNNTISTRKLTSYKKGFNILVLLTSSILKVVSKRELFTTILKLLKAIVTYSTYL